MINMCVKLYSGYWKNRLTVLAYHRIVSDEEFNAEGTKVAVSTSVSQFKQQMQFIKQHFSVISMEDLQLFLQGKAALPPRPALITFDDGYQDVLTNSMPILEPLGIPATVFLATDYMGTERMFLWDRASYCFKHTQLNSVDLPLLGQSSWQTDEERGLCLKKWLAASKKCSDKERHEATQLLEQALDVECPSENKGGTSFLTWEQIRLLTKKGFDFGGHTCSHPILTKVDPSQLMDELALSKQKIEQETQQEVFSFAYPNGLVDDYDANTIEVLKELGYLCAFTLAAGPMPMGSVKKDPLEIQRVTVTAKDNYKRFILKVMGLVKFKAFIGLEK